MISALLLFAQLTQTAPFDTTEVSPISGIKVVYERDGLMDLDIWGAEYEYPVVKPLPTPEVSRSRRVLTKAFAKYPPGFIKRFLDRVYVVGDLIVDGYEYGATYSGRSIFIVNGGTAMGFDDRFLEQSFHHEFSSVLFLQPKNQFPRQAWADINPKSFAYRGYDQVYADKKGEVDWEEQKPSWLRQGFVKRYSLTSMEEDLNTVAESVFGAGRSFWKLADKYPKILAKARLVIQFYDHLDSGFSEAKIRQYR